MDDQQLTFNLQLLEIVKDNLTGLLTFGCVFAWIVFHYIASVMKTASRERTRREIAAYVAEGTMTPEQGERLLKARAKGEPGEA